jgi:dimethylargininase
VKRMPQSACVYRFNSAIVREPSRSVIRGLRAQDRGSPTYEGVKAEHEAYVAALRAAGVKVTILPPLEDFPDSIFIEDPALVFTEGAIVLRPGAPTRAGEAAAIEPTLHTRFPTVLKLAPGGFADGGDVLVTPQRVLIGRSSRTDAAGASALVDCLTQLGRQSQIISTPRDVLHFKTDCSLLDEETVVSTARLAQADIFKGFKQLLVPPGEAAAANALRVNDVVLVGSQFPRTIDMLNRAGFNVVPLPTSEIGKIDAGLSCMSLRWQAS